MSDAPVFRSTDQNFLEHTIVALRADFSAATLGLSLDAQTRITYDKLISKSVSELYLSANSGKISWDTAARQATDLRNVTMSVLRLRSTPIGRAVAEYVKSEGRGINYMISRKTLQLFGGGADFFNLSLEQKNVIYAEIVKSAGKSNPVITDAMRRLLPFSRCLFAFSIAMAIYNIAVAEDKMRAAQKEIGILTAGVLGGAAGGAIAGLACGPGAPVCVTIGAFVGGAVAAFGFSMVF